MPSTGTVRSYLLVDGENIDATLGNVLERRPEPGDRPRWDRVLDVLRERAGGDVRALFFLNASSGHLPMSFVQALTAIGFRVVPLAGPREVKVVDVGILRTLEALLSRDGDVVVASHDVDFLPQVRALVESGRRVGMLGFPEYLNRAYDQLADAGLESLDLEADTGAFFSTLPRVRILSVDEFDPEVFL